MNGKDLEDRVSGSPAGGTTPASPVPAAPAPSPPAPSPAPSPPASSSSPSSSPTTSPIAHAGKPELLAPAGGWEQLEYAIRYGADAVYLAAERFGMRQRASNFTEDELDSVVAYAHERGVKVHIACNIVMHEDDIEALPAYFEKLEASGADAVILGDLGAMRLARLHAPDVEVHVSTQASVSNAEAAKAWYEMGARRVVVAREMSLAGIASMREKMPADMELEAFVHGSVCMAYSGRCMVSDFLANRSGLGGHCTQPCRWQYALVEEKRPGVYIPVEEDEHGSYIMNAEDMNMLAHLRELADAGIDSFKIEGRNKKAYYVATVVNAYRQVLDGASPEQMARELDAVSHRPYGTGFYFGPAQQHPQSIDYIRDCDWAGEVESCELLDGIAVGRADGAGELGETGEPNETAATVEVQSAEEAGALAMAGSRRLFRIGIRLRNKFRVGDELEAISPKRPTVAFRVEAIQHLPEFDTRKLDAGEAYYVQEASRGLELYLVDAFLDEELHPHDILRIWR